MHRIQLLRRIYNHVSRTGNFPLEHYSEDAEFDASAAGAAVTGDKREAARLWREYVECFEEFQIEPIEFIEAGSDQIVVVVRDGGRVKESEAEIHNEFTHVWTFGPDDRVTSWATFPTRAQAFEYAGLARSR